MNHEIFGRAFAACPLIVVLRGVRPDEVVAVGEALIAAGIHILEVPLNAPDAFESITRLSALASDDVIIGASNVLDVDSVLRVQAAGGQMIALPHVDPTVVAAAIAAEMAVLPGIFTATEAFAAIAAGAHGLKFFPAEAGSPAVIKALRAVLPRTVPLLPVGGMTSDGLGAWADAGADGFGLDALFIPGATAEECGDIARRFVAALSMKVA